VLIAKPDLRNLAHLDELLAAVVLRALRQRLAVIPERMKRKRGALILETHPSCTQMSSGD